MYKLELLEKTQSGPEGISGFMYTHTCTCTNYKTSDLIVKHCNTTFVTAPWNSVETVVMYYIIFGCIDTSSLPDNQQVFLFEFIQD